MPVLEPLKNRLRCLKRPRTPALATVFGAPPDKSAKTDSSNASDEPAGAPRAGRSKLLLEAVPEKAAEQHTGASAKEDAGSPDAPAAADANEPAAEA